MCLPLYWRLNLQLQTPFNVLRTGKGKVHTYLFFFTTPPIKTHLQLGFSYENLPSQELVYKTAGVSFPSTQL